MAAGTPTVRVVVELPADVSRESSDVLAARMRDLLVIDEVRAGRITRPTGARLLGMRLDDFLRLAGEHGVYAIDYDLDDFESELRAIHAGRTAQ